ncbi:hypothetical protein Leryth_017526 [Lithospermum erythrorhizon]|uniref:MADS-box domain-containing protein n=1 Tax=Lithospermum erythrorhizon TaxID=34254 RepID=A0AAV3Q4T2_LITER|nr:hypothetical protein Leryth_017526 [Lithospermum erythrorhizon]
MRGKSSVPSLIQDKRKRIQTFLKRRKCLEKKAYELSTLCDVNICMIMFAPDDEIKGTNDPIIWPEDPNVTHRMISLYQNKHKLGKNCSKNADIASVYQDRARIVGKEVEKLKKLEIEDKYPIWDELYDSFSYDKLLMVGNELDNILLVLQSRIDSMKTNQMFQAVSSYNPLHGLNSFNCLGNEAALALHNSQSVNTIYESLNYFGNEGALVRPNSQTMKIMDGSLNCFGNEGALVRRNSQAMNIMDESLNCFGNEGALVRRNSVKIMDGSFNCFGNEGTLFLHNSQTMKIMDQSSSCSNFHNYNNNNVPVPANFDHMILNTSHDLPPLPGFGDNFVQNNNNLVMDQLQSQYLCYAPLQSQKPVFMPVPSPSIDAYSLMMHGEIGDAKIDQFGNIFF